MTLRKLFEKQVFIRLTDDQTAFISTAKWLLLTRIRRVSVSEAGHDCTPQATEPDWIALADLPVPRHNRLE